MKQYTTVAESGSKPHYELLDALRGVAALIVVWYHIFEGFATSPLDQKFNHGYLAVDFFFLLSGFVTGYAYDDRWPAMKMRDFVRRRLVRLHPMVVAGVVLGVLSYFIQGCVKWDGTQVSAAAVLLAALSTLFLFPAWPGSFREVRGYGEMFPLNGPLWSLFFEYIANILYGLFIRRLPRRWLMALTVTAGAALAVFAAGNGSGFHNLGVGWTLGGLNFPGGMLRVLFSFSAGLLMSRGFRPGAVKGAFWKCSALLVALMAVPYVGKGGVLNGIYDTFCVVVAFPLVLHMAASGKASGRFTGRLSRFLGDISYPLYVIHYPFVYLFFAWLWKGEGVTFAEALPYALLIFFGCIALAALMLKFYDLPVRRRLSVRGQTK